MAYMTKVYLSQMWLSKTDAAVVLQIKLALYFLMILRLNGENTVFLKTMFRSFFFRAVSASRIVLVLLALMFKGAILCHY